MQSPLALFLKRFSFRNMPKSEKVPTKRSIFDLVHMVQMLRAIYRSVCFLSLLNHEECRANIKSEPGNHHGHLAPIINPQRFSSLRRKCQDTVLILRELIHRTRLCDHVMRIAVRSLSHSHRRQWLPIEIYVEKGKPNTK